MSFILGALSVKPPISAIGPKPPPSFLPTIGGVVPNIFADFTTEGVANQYWAGNFQESSFATWIRAISGSFTRASTASFINSSGNLAQASINAARFDYDPLALTSRGMLREGTSTNVALQSNNFSNAVWSPNVTSITQNATGPDGVSNSAWTVVSDGGVSSISQTLAPGVTNTHSYWVKKGTDNFAWIQIDNNISGSIQWFNLASGTVGTTSASGPALSNPQITAFRNGWFRISVTADSTAIDTIIGPSDADADRTSTSGRTIIIFGAQVETLGFMSSYIPTTSASVTRAADVLVATPSFSFAFPFTELVAFDDTALGQGMTKLDINNGGSDTNRIELFTFTDNMTGIITQGGTGSTNARGGTISAGVKSLVAARIDRANLAFAQDGVITWTDSGLTGVPILTELQFGSGSEGDLYGHLWQVGLWAGVGATNAQLQALT